MSSARLRAMCRNSAVSDPARLLYVERRCYSIRQVSSTENWTARTAKLGVVVMVTRVDSLRLKESLSFDAKSDLTRMPDRAKKTGGVHIKRMYQLSSNPDALKHLMTLHCPSQLTFKLLLTLKHRQNGSNGAWPSCEGGSFQLPWSMMGSLPLASAAICTGSFDSSSSSGTNKSVWGAGDLLLYGRIAAFDATDKAQAPFLFGVETGRMSASLPLA
jgi:hypothetical protein